MADIMNGRSIIRNSVDFKPVPRTPVAYIDGGTWALHNKKMSMRQLLDMPDGGAKVLMGFYEEFDPDIVWVAPACYNYAAKALGGSVEDDKIGSAPELTKSFFEQGDKLPELSVKEVKEKLKADEDFKKMIIQTKTIAEKYKGEKYIAINYIGPFTLASQLVGVTEFMMRICEADEETDKLLTLSGNICRAFYEVFLEAGADMIFIGDPSSSGDLISPVMFDSLALPCLKKLCEDIRDKADIILLHICGNTKDRVAQLVGSGIDIFSVDSIDIKEAMLNAKKDFAIFGNIAPVEILCEMEKEEVERICKDIAQQGGLDGGFGLLPGCDIAPATAKENVLAMINTAKNYKNAKI